MKDYVYIFLEENNLEDDDPYAEILLVTTHEDKAQEFLKERSEQAIKDMNGFGELVDITDTKFYVENKINDSTISGRIEKFLIV